MVYLLYLIVSRLLNWLAPFPAAGETMRIASSEFADDPCSSVKRGTMVRAARALLSAVTRLLILADMADVMRLLSHLKIVSARPPARPPRKGFYLIGSSAKSFVFFSLKHFC